MVFNKLNDTVKSFMQVYRVKDNKREIYFQISIEKLE